MSGRVCRCGVTEADHAVLPPWRPQLPCFHFVPADLSLAKVRAELNGAAELAGLSDEEVAALGVEDPRGAESQTAVPGHHADRERGSSMPNTSVREGDSSESAATAKPVDASGVPARGVPESEESPSVRGAA